MKVKKIEWLEEVYLIKTKKGKNKYLTIRKVGDKYQPLLGSEFSTIYEPLTKPEKTKKEAYNRAMFSLGGKLKR